MAHAARQEARVRRLARRPAPLGRLARRDPQARPVLQEWRRPSPSEARKQEIQARTRLFMMLQAARTMCWILSSQEVQPDPPVLQALLGPRVLRGLPGQPALREQRAPQAPPDPAQG